MRALRTIALVLALAVAGSAGTYTLRWGDTLSGVAHRFGVPLGALLAANHVADPDHVREGQLLVIPGAAPVAAPTAAPSVHRVAPGETLGGIARRYGTSVADLAARNGIRNPNRLREGLVLHLGAAAPTWICPVQGVVELVSGFGDPRAGGHKHQGVDIAAPRGRPVVANVSGVLTHHPNPLGGLAYYLQGDDGDTYYGAHLDSYVGPDRHVRLGEAIGRVGNTGDAHGGITHLHFERLAKGGAAVDPAPRLLPVCPTG